MERPVILELKNITKTYPGVVALDNINVDIRKGEVLAIAGENGAGKSTMMKLISGAITPDSGSIIYEGKEYSEMTPSLSRELGITVVYQEFNLVASLSVAENLFLGEYPGGKIMPDFRFMKKRAKEIFDDMGIDIDPSAKVGDLSTSYCQLVEIAKALTRELRILILDEPTAALTVHETEILFRLIAKLRKKGTTILYVSHRMSEMFEICDRVTVFRDGRNVDTKKMSEIDMDGLIKMMVGHEVNATYPVRKAEIGEVILKVENMCGLGVENINFELRKGDDDDKIRLNQRKPSKYKGLRRFGPEKNLQRINKFMREWPLFCKNHSEIEKDFSTCLSCPYYTMKAVIIKYSLSGLN